MCPKAVGNEPPSWERLDVGELMGLLQLSDGHRRTGLAPGAGFAPPASPTPALQAAGARLAAAA